MNKIVTEEIYEIFFRFGISRNEFDQWLNDIKLDRKKTESFLVDLILCPFIKAGLEQKHLNYLSKILGHKNFRANNLSQRLYYLKNYIVKDK